MVVSRKVITLMIAVAILAAGLFTMLDRTYAFTSTVSVEGDEAKVAVYAATNTGAQFSIKNGSTDTLFSDGTIYEPGGMYTARITVANQGEAPFAYWFYPCAEKVTGTNLAEEVEGTNLADVLDVYIYGGAYDNINNGRPTLPENVLDENAESEPAANNGKWTYLGLLSQLPPKTKPEAFGSLNEDTSHTYTLLLKMRESAGNEYQGKSVKVCVKMMVEQII